MKARMRNKEVYSLVTKLMNSETHSCTVSLASLAIFPLGGSAFFMMRLMLAMGRKRSCSRKLERGLCSPLSWLPPPPPPHGLAGASDMVAGTLIGGGERGEEKTWYDKIGEIENPREIRQKGQNKNKRRKKKTVRCWNLLWCDFVFGREKKWTLEKRGVRRRWRWEWEVREI